MNGTTVTVIRPELTDEERARRMKEITKALAAFARAAAQKKEGAKA